MADNVDTLKLSKELLSIMAPYYKGSSAQSAGRFESLQHRRNATQALRAGEREAQDIRKAARVMDSDARLAMIAQGGTVDHGMLAKLRREHDLNAISALYDAKADALTSEFAARQADRQADREYRAGQLGMLSNILSAASTYSYSKGTAPKARPKPGASYRRSAGSLDYGSH